MRAFIFVLFALGASMSYAQSIIISRDSSKLVFPSEVAVMFSPSFGGGRGFQVSSTEMKVLITEINFLLNRLTLEQENIALYRQKEELLRSSSTVMEKKYLMELERTVLYKSAYESLEKVSGTYQAELQHCKSDLEKLSQADRRSKRRGFLNGLVWGTVIGGVLGIVVDTAGR